MAKNALLPATVTHTYTHIDNSSILSYEKSKQLRIQIASLKTDLKLLAGNSGIAYRWRQVLLTSCCSLGILEFISKSFPLSSAGGLVSGAPLRPEARMFRGETNSLCWLKAMA